PRGAQPNRPKATAGSPPPSAPDFEIPPPAPERPRSSRTRPAWMARWQPTSNTSIAPHRNREQGITPGVRRTDAVADAGTGTGTESGNGSGGLRAPIEPNPKQPARADAKRPAVAGAAGVGFGAARGPIETSPIETNDKTTTFW